MPDSFVLPFSSILVWSYQELVVDHMYFLDDIKRSRATIQF